MNTPEKGVTMNQLRKLHESAKLNNFAEFYFSPTKSVEELYDCVTDPHNVHNIADDPKHSEVLKRMRSAHLRWVQDTKDVGLIPEPIIAKREKELGSPYAILRQSGGDDYNARLGSIAASASGGIDALQKLIDAMSDPDDAIRYWGATGIGNIGVPAKGNAAKLMDNALNDKSSAVRTAAARALCRMGVPDKALPVLIQELTKGAQWERLYAANALDEIDEQARPVIEHMQEGLKYQNGFNSNGKYRVRVINRVLNELNGTNNVVP
jgi:uncharacterized sulfatase